MAILFPPSFPSQLLSLALSLSLSLWSVSVSLSFSLLLSLSLFVSRPPTCLSVSQMKRNKPNGQYKDFLHCLNINVRTKEVINIFVFSPPPLTLFLTVWLPSHTQHMQPEYDSFLEQDRDIILLPSFSIVLICLLFLCLYIPPSFYPLPPSPFLCLCKNIVPAECCRKGKGRVSRVQPFGPTQHSPSFCHFVWLFHCRPSSLLSLFNSIKISGITGTVQIQIWKLYWLQKPDQPAEVYKQHF